MQLIVAIDSPWKKLGKQQQWILDWKRLRNKLIKRLLGIGKIYDI